MEKSEFDEFRRLFVGRKVGQILLIRSYYIIYFEGAEIKFYEKSYIVNGNSNQVFPHGNSLEILRNLIGTSISDMSYSSGIYKFSFSSGVYIELREDEALYGELFSADCAFEDKTYGYEG